METAAAKSFPGTDKPCVLDPLATEDEAAKYLRLQPQTLRKWRVSGSGPAFVRVGSAIRYRMSDLLEFIEAGRRASPSA